VLLDVEPRRQSFAILATEALEHGNVQQLIWFRMHPTTLLRRESRAPGR
jgi:hypothetical protein